MGNSSVNSSSTEKGLSCNGSQAIHKSTMPSCCEKGKDDFEVNKEEYSLLNL